MVEEVVEEGKSCVVMQKNSKESKMLLLCLVVLDIAVFSFETC